MYLTAKAQIAATRLPAAAQDVLDLVKNIKKELQRSFAIGIEFFSERGVEYQIIVQDGGKLDGYQTNQSLYATQHARTVQGSRELTALLRFQIRTVWVYVLLRYSTKNSANAYISRVEKSADFSDIQPRDAKKWQTLREEATKTWKCVNSKTTGVTVEIDETTELFARMQGKVLSHDASIVLQIDSKLHLYRQWSPEFRSTLVFQSEKGTVLPNVTSSSKLEPRLSDNAACFTIDSGCVYRDAFWMQLPRTGTWIIVLYEKRIEANLMQHNVWIHFCKSFSKTPEDDCFKAFSNDAKWSEIRDDAANTVKMKNQAYDRCDYRFRYSTEGSEVTVNFEWLGDTADAFMIYGNACSKVLAVKESSKSEYELTMVEDSKLDFVAASTWYMLYSGTPGTISLMTEICSSNGQEKIYLGIGYAMNGLVLTAVLKKFDDLRDMSLFPRLNLSVEDHGRFKYNHVNSEEAWENLLPDCHLIPIGQRFPRVQELDFVNRQLHLDCNYKIARFQGSAKNPNFLSLNSGKLTMKHANPRVSATKRLIARLFNDRKRTGSTWKFQGLRKLSETQYSASLLHLTSCEKNPFKTDVSDCSPITLQFQYPAWTIKFANNDCLWCINDRDRPIKVTTKNPSGHGSLWLFLDVSG